VSCAYLVYCVSRILFRMSLAMDVRCVTCSVDHVERFVLCIQVHRGLAIINLLFSNQYLMFMEYLCVYIYI